MPTFGGLSAELSRIRSGKRSSYVNKRLDVYLSALHKHTERNIVMYMTGWTRQVTNPEIVSITDDDIAGFMEVVHGTDGGGLDLILHSPGGSAEVVESIVNYLRSKFTDIRVIVPHAAMSAATMLACASNEIVMGKQSSLGPIDPQIFIRTRHGVRSVSVHHIIEEFETVKKISIEDKQQLVAWVPILQQYSPGLVGTCRHAHKMSICLTTKWLKTYMLDGNKEKACSIAQKLSDPNIVLSHAKHISKDGAKDLGLKIYDLEEDQKLQDLVLSVYHAAKMAFEMGTAKIIKNHLGKTYSVHYNPPKAA